MCVLEIHNVHRVVYVHKHASLYSGMHICVCDSGCVGFMPIYDGEIITLTYPCTFDNDSWEFCLDHVHSLTTFTVTIVLMQWVEYPS